MILVIMRHGAASWSAPSDEARPLTTAGIAEVGRTSEKLSGISLDSIFTSPYLRARQSAEVISDHQQCRVTVLDSITPSGIAGDVINQLPDRGNTLLVSHMPFVGKLASMLCYGTLHSEMSFLTGAAMVLEMEYPGVGMASVVDIINP